MKASAFVSLFLVCIGSLDLFLRGSYAFSPLEFLFGAGSVVLRIIYIAIGIGANFLVLFVLIYKPFRTLGT